MQFDYYKQHCAHYAMPQYVIDVRVNKIEYLKGKKRNVCFTVGIYYRLVAFQSVHIVL